MSAVDWERWLGLAAWPLQVAVDLLHEREPNYLYYNAIEAYDRSWQGAEGSATMMVGMALRHRGALPEAQATFDAAERDILAGALACVRFTGKSLEEASVHWVAPAGVARWALAQGLAVPAILRALVGELVRGGPSVDMGQPDH